MRKDLRQLYQDYLLQESCFGQWDINILDYVTFCHNMSLYNKYDYDMLNSWEAASMNEDFMRLALAINANYESFNKNVSSLVLYFLYHDGESCRYSGEELRDIIKQEANLEFTQDEVNAVLRQCEKEQLIIKIDSQFALDEKGYKKASKTPSLDIKQIIERYCKEVGISEYSSDQVFQLICAYLYSVMDKNIADLLLLLKGESMQDDDTFECERYKEEEKEIINRFLDWEDADKNEVIVRLIAFSVDYCQLTTKKNKKSFASLLSGKRFLLDTNIIYRLMGINNKSRQIATEEFITKCEEVGIQLYYTNFIYQELLDSFDYHIKALRDEVHYVSITPDRLRKLHGLYSKEDSFYSIYYSWAAKNDGFGKWTEFRDYLRGQLRQVLRRFKLSEIENSAVFQRTHFETLCADLSNFKLDRKSVGQASIQCDIQNVMYIEKSRKEGNGTAWGVTDYMVSTDQLLIGWAQNVFVRACPYVTLPSVWYSLILKVSGRSNDDYASYIEFMKIRYRQEFSFNAANVIRAISETTDNVELQNKIVDRLIEETEDAVTSNISQIDVEEKVQLAYKQIRDNELKSSERIGGLKVEKEHLIQSSKHKAKRRRMINRVLIAVSATTSILAAIAFGWLIWYKIPEDKQAAIGTVASVIPGMLSWIPPYIISKKMSTNLNDLELLYYAELENEVKYIEVEIQKLTKECYSEQP